MDTQTALPTRLTADRCEWSEDLTWLAQSQLEQAVGHAPARVAHVHLHRSPLRRRNHRYRDTVGLVEVRLADGDAVCAEAVGPTPQSAIFMALRLIQRRPDPNRARRLLTARRQVAS